MRLFAYISQIVRCIVLISTNNKLTSADDGDQAGHEIIIAPRSGI